MLRYQHIIKAIVLALGLAFSSIAFATPVNMTFAGLDANGEWVNTYYDGGCGGSFNGGPMHCGGPNYGVVWTNALACGAPIGACSGMANEPTPPNVLAFFYNPNGQYFMNLTSGFTDGFSFYYASPNVSHVITVYSGLNGTGTVLDTLVIPTTSVYCAPPVLWSCWSLATLNFSGTAKSVLFGTSYEMGISDVTLLDDLAVHPVPEPQQVYMFGFGVLLIGLSLRLRRLLN